MIFDWISWNYTFCFIFSFPVFSNLLFHPLGRLTVRVVISRNLWYLFSFILDSPSFIIDGNNNR